MTAAATPEMLPVVHGPVVLRRLRPADLAAFQAYRSDPELGRYQGWVPMSDEEALAFLQDVATAPLLAPGHWSQVAIAEPRTDRLLGDIGIFIAEAHAHAEIGFTLARPLHGRGLATAAVTAAIDMIFAHRPVPRIIGVTDARNAASCRLLARVGMVRVSTDDAVFRGEPCVEHTYALTRAPAAAKGAASGPAPPVRLVDWRLLSASQQAGVRGLSISAQQVEYAGAVDTQLAAVQAQTSDDLVGLCVLLGEQPVGFLVLKHGAQAPAWAPVGAAVISGMRIDASRQGQGIGSAALMRLPDWVGRHWPAVQSLALSVDEENARGLHAYRRAGFLALGPPVQGRIGPVLTLVRTLGRSPAS